MIAQILIVNTALYTYGNIRLKEISILNWFEQIKENILAGSAFSARLGSSVVAFIPDRFSTFFGDRQGTRRSDKPVPFLPHKNRIL